MRFIMLVLVYVMPVENLRSITIRVLDADQAAEQYGKALGMKPVEEAEIVEAAGIKVRYLKLPNITLAFVQAWPPDGPFSMLVKRQGEGLHLLTFNAKNIEETMNEWKNNGTYFSDDPPRSTAKGGKVTITKPYKSLKEHSMNGVMIELTEEND